MSVFTPGRRRDAETLDHPETDPRLAVRSLRDVARSNTLFGGAHAVLVELQRALALMHPGPLRLLDIGSGIGDITRRARSTASSGGFHVCAIALEIEPGLARVSAQAADAAVCADGLSLPFTDDAVDIAFCSQVLHHFPDEEAELLLREMDRVASVRVIVADLRRSWLAIAGLWTASFPLRFHPVSRHDGIVSIRRGYTARELRALVARAVGREPDVRQRRGFRLTASWTPA
jgi:2-polyprenyl-3-methyl-5-hydroxy-6-metoxy-1,4-benzoquinol methylase